jgi:hypothetical protein
MVNDREVGVTRNLESALRRLRSSYSPILIWADALSLNQSDLGELSVQVSRMWAVFGYAAHVVVDLGERSDDSDLGIEMVLKLSSVSERSERQALQYINESIQFPRDKSWRALRQLLNRPWWHRVWIVQVYSSVLSTIMGKAKR